MIRIRVLTVTRRRKSLILFEKDILFESNSRILCLSTSDMSSITFGIKLKFFPIYHRAPPLFRIPNK